MIFTYDGYIDKSNRTPCAWARRNGNKLEYGIRNVPVSAIASMNVRKHVDEPHSLADAMTFLYNISLGQRTTTPTFQNKFIDRFAKTFFSDSYRISLVPKTDVIINASSFANYFHMRRWNSDYGVVEALYDEYRVLQGNLVRWLQDASCRGNGNMALDPTIPDDRILGHDERLAKNVAELLKDDDDAVAFVEGVFMTCCWRDHSDTDKDLKNTRLREAIDTMKDEYLRVPSNSPKQFFSRENIRRLIKIGRSPQNLYFVLEGSDDVIDLLSFEPGAYEPPEDEGDESRRRPSNANDAWNATVPVAIPPEDDRKWKKAARKLGGPVTRKIVPSPSNSSPDEREWLGESPVRISYMTPEQLEQAQREIGLSRSPHKEQVPYEDLAEEDGDFEENAEMEHVEDEEEAEEQPKKKRRTRRGGKKNRERRQRQAGGE